MTHFASSERACPLAADWRRPPCSTKQRSGRQTRKRDVERVRASVALVANRPHGESLCKYIEEQPSRIPLSPARRNEVPFQHPLGDAGKLPRGPAQRLPGAAVAPERGSRSTSAAVTGDCDRFESGMHAESPKQTADVSPDCLGAQL
jgi:hypothetical protein